MTLRYNIFIKKKVPKREPRARKRPQKYITTKIMTLLDINKPTKLELAIIKDQRKIAMSIIKYNSKIHKPTLYYKATNNLIYGC